MGSLLLVACQDSPSDPFAAACTGTVPLNLEIGEVAEPQDLVGGGVCLEATVPADFVVVVAVGDAGPALAAHQVDILGSGFEVGSDRVLSAPLPEGPSTSVARAAPSPTGSAAGYEARGLEAPRVERPALPTLELDRRIRSRGPRGRRLDTGRGNGSGGAARSVPAVGGVQEYPTAVSCTASPDVRRGRVVAVTDHAVILLDEEAPSPGFTDNDVAEFGAFFDLHVYGPLVDVFGSPSDLDGNGRVVVFFTPSANALSSPGAGTVVGGYFWGGDLFPRDDDPDSGLAGCATSAEGEVLYMSVPDPDGLIAAPIRADQLQTRAVLAHELQHLLNASRRLHANGADVLEATWLNEGLSYLAEEMLFQRVTGTSPGENLDGPSLERRGLVEAFNQYAYANLGRYNVFLQAPHVHSLMGSDGIETRGAAWAFLRYALDQSNRPDSDLLRELLNSTESGLGTLHGALGIDPLQRMAEWAVSLAADDLAGAADPRYQQPSWATPSLIASLRADRRYPLRVVGIPPDQGVRFSLRAGGAGFGSLRLEPFATAHLRVVADGDAKARAFLVRVR